VITDFLDNEWRFYINKQEREIFSKMESKSQTLERLFNIKYGLRTGDNEKYVTDKETEYPLIAGADISSLYQVKWSPKYLKQIEGLPESYFKENFNYLTAIFGTEIEYEFFQSLVLGLPIGLDSEIKYNYKHTRDFYILSSYKKKDLRKIESEEEDAIFVQYYLNTTTLQLDRISIQVPSDTVAIDIDYTNRVDYEGFMLPEQTLIKIVQPKDSIFINLDFGSVKLNDCREIDINIPESYVKCK